jgi:hypothetical protein
LADGRAPVCAAANVLAVEPDVESSALQFFDQLVDKLAIETRIANEDFAQWTPLDCYPAKNAQ